MHANQPLTRESCSETLQHSDKARTAHLDEFHQALGNSANEGYPYGYPGEMGHFMYSRESLFPVEESTLQFSGAFEINIENYMSRSIQSEAF